MMPYSFDNWRLGGCKASQVITQAIIDNHQRQQGIKEVSNFFIQAEGAANDVIGNKTDTVVPLPEGVCNCWGRLHHITPKCTEASVMCRTCITHNWRPGDFDKKGHLVEDTTQHAKEVTTPMQNYNPGDTVYYSGTKGGAMTHPATVLGVTHLPEGVHYVLQGRNSHLDPFVRPQYRLTDIAPAATVPQMLNRALKAGEYTVEPYGQQEPGKRSLMFKVAKEMDCQRWYVVDENMCSCDDFKFRSGLTGGMCKHRMACVLVGVLGQ